MILSPSSLPLWRKTLKQLQHQRHLVHFIFIFFGKPHWEKVYVFGHCPNMYTCTLPNSSTPSSSVLNLCWRREGRPWATARRSVSIEKEVFTTHTHTLTPTPKHPSYRPNQNQHHSSAFIILTPDLPDPAPLWRRWKANFGGRWNFFHRGRFWRCWRVQALKTLLHQQEVNIKTNPSADWLIDFVL